MMLNFAIVIADPLVTTALCFIRMPRHELRPEHLVRPAV
jgi:hypothetical protein